MQNWKTIWENRHIQEGILEKADKESLFMELKRANGFDLIGDGLTYEAFMEQYEKTKSNLCRCKNCESSYQVKSVYEIGFGSGANLFLFENDGFACGGVDYSHSLYEIADQILDSEDLQCDEALNLNVEPVYDAVLSNSVFSYFPDLEYAEKVLEKALQKTRYSIGLLDLHDEDRKEAFLEYRKKLTPDYEERYKNLPKLFYPKKFFEDFAEKHDLDLCFMPASLKGYWNNEFLFHCYLYKKVNQ